MYEKQKEKLLSLFDENVIKAFQISNVIIAGGTITSIFSNKEVNDYDLYFRTKEDMIKLITNLYASDKNLEEDECADICPYDYIFCGLTSRSVNFTHNGIIFQLIHFDYYNDAHEIFKDYDFTINMGAYDFKINDFVLHDEFLPTIAERRIVFNKMTTYPIISLLRVQKYLERGYTISKKEMFKISLAINARNIDSWETLKDQLSGFYGVNVNEFFDVTKKFDLYDAIDMLELVKDDHYVIPHNQMSLDLDTLLHLLENPNQKIFFKKIVKIGDEYCSLYKNNFIWNVGEYHDGGEYGIFCCLNEENAKNYNSWQSYHKNTAIAVLLINDSEQASIHSNEVVLYGKVFLVKILEE